MQNKLEYYFPYFIFQRLLNHFIFAYSNVLNSGVFSCLSIYEFTYFENIIRKYRKCSHKDQLKRIWEKKNLIKITAF